MFRTILILLLALLLRGQGAEAQTSLEFLIISPDAVTSARGETGIAWEDRLQGILNNPANLLNCRQEVSLSWGRRVAGINQFQAVATLTPYSPLPLAFGITSMHYGELSGYDIYGNETGQFSAQDVMLYGSTAYRWRRVNLGSTLRLIYSGIEDYHLSAFALDLGASYELGSSGWFFGAVWQNAGLVLSEYSNSADTELPTRLRTGIAKKLKHLPLRWFLDYTLLGEVEGALQLGADFYLPIGWTLRGGYLFDQGSDRLEKLDEAMRGMTLGFGGEFSGSWALDYSYTTLGVLGSVHNVTLSRSL